MGRIIPYIMENKKCLKPPTNIELGVSYPNGSVQVVAPKTCRVIQSFTQVTIFHPKQ